MAPPDGGVPPEPLSARGRRFPSSSLGWGPSPRSGVPAVLISLLMIASVVFAVGPSVLSGPAASGPARFVTLDAPATLTFSPMSGVVGSEVVLTGANFTAGDLVTPAFGGSTSACVQGPVTVEGNGSFTCSVTVPASSAGPYNISANTLTDGTVLATENFTVEPALAFSPSSGIVGSEVTLNGSGFTSGASVTPYFGGASSSCNEGAIDVAANGSFVCTILVPGAPAGTHPISASTTPDGTVIAPGSFTIGAFVSLSPTSGTVASTTTATGTGFLASHSIAFKLAGVSASSTCTSSASGSFSCSVTIPGVPNGAQPMVASDGTNSASATFTVEPSLALSPTSGVVGSTTNAAGAGFLASHAITFKLDGVAAASPCTSSASGGFSCVVTIPAVPNGAQPMVASDGTNSATATFSVDASLALSPTSGVVGSTTTATGSGFDPSSPITFTLAGLAASSTCSSSGSGSFTCTVSIPSAPHGPQPMVASDGTNSASATYDVNASLSLNPTTGIVGSTTTATGAGFVASHPITFKLDGVAASSTCTSDSSGSFTCGVTVPSVPDGTQTMVASDGTNTASTMFTVTPVAITVTPGQGPVGSSLTVSGTGFTFSSGAAVSFGGVTLTPQGCSVGNFTGDTITTTSGGLFTCAFKVPADEMAGAYNVVATDIVTSTTTGPVQFTVTVVAITVTPGQGPVGASVTVAGSGFSVSTPLASLTFGGVIAPACTSGSLITGGSGTFSCTFAVPAGTSGEAVTAVDAGGQSVNASFKVTALALTLAPGQGPTGAAVVAAGTGFSVSTALASLVFGGKSVTACTTGSLTASSAGAFSCAFAVPSGVAATTVTVTATDVGGQTASSAFEVTTLGVVVTPGRGTVGSLFTLNTTGFAVSLPSTVSFNGSSLSPVACSEGSVSGRTITTNATGGISCTFSVPALPGGTETISVVQGTDRENASFVVTAGLDLAPNDGPVGTTGTAVGSGFLASTAYSVAWNTSTPLCAGTTNATGAFSCPYTIPAAPAGPHGITATQGDNVVEEFFFVAPHIALSTSNGAVGASVTLSGTGFDASMPYTVNWGSSTNLCSGTTNTNGNLECTFVIPSSPVGSASVTVLEGAFALTASLTVTPSAPASSSGSTPFPWWVVAVGAFAAGAVLAAALVYEHRRHRRPGARPMSARQVRPVQPWEESAGPAPGTAPLAAPAPAAGATVGAGTGVPASGVVATAPAGEPADIDVLIARLEKMSMEMFKKTPKQLGEQGFEEETTKTTDQP